MGEVCRIARLWAGRKVSYDQRVVVPGVQSSDMNCNYSCVFSAPCGLKGYIPGVLVFRVCLHLGRVVVACNRAVRGGSSSVKCALED